MTAYQKYLKQVGEFGVVEEVHQSIALLSGLPGAALDELVVFEEGQLGQVFMINQEGVEVLQLSRINVKKGAKAVRTDHLLSIPISNQLLGQMVDPLGRPLSQKSIRQPADKIEGEYFPIDCPPSGLLNRSRIKESQLTGTAIVDLFMPLGQGQKELVIGERKVGKTSFLLTCLKAHVLNKGLGIYCMIGKSKNDLKKLEQFLTKEKIREKVIVVASNAYDSPSLIYQSPYSAMTIAEYFRDLGEDVLLILDDLSTHARIYREISLLARRFPGRDAYPGDIFYAHARLLERAGNFKIGKEEHSITVLPVAEIIEGDMTSYVATNLMGMTDGHIFFDSNAYFRGQRPAINLSLSVTRVGRQVQSTLLRSINREATALLQEYERMQNLSQFGAELSDGAKQVLQIGETIRLLFNQPVELIVALEVQVIFFAIVWLGLISAEDLKTHLKTYRQNLISAWGNPRSRKTIEKILDTDDFNELLDRVTKNKEEFMQLLRA